MLKVKLLLCTAYLNCQFFVWTKRTLNTFSIFFISTFFSPHTFPRRLNPTLPMHSALKPRISPTTSPIPRYLTLHLTKMTRRKKKESPIFLSRYVNLVLFDDARGTRKARSTGLREVARETARLDGDVELSEPYFRRISVPIAKPGFIEWRGGFISENGSVASWGRRVAVTPLVWDRIKPCEMGEETLFIVMSPARCYTRGFSVCILRKRMRQIGRGGVGNLSANVCHRYCAA